MRIIKSTSIVLESGLLLSKEILEQMAFQSHLFKLQYENYPDGIIYGFEYTEENEIPYLSQGLIKYKGKYYFSTQKINLNDVFDEFDNDEIIENTIHSSLAFFPCPKEIVNEGIVSDCLQLKLCTANDKMLLEQNAVILLEFQYHIKKRILMPKITATEELNNQLYSKEYYFTFINVKYSMPNETTFSPYIFGLMKRCLSEKKNKSTADLMLLFMLCQNKILSLEVLKEWFSFYNKTMDLCDRKNIIRLFMETVRIENTKEKLVQPSFTIQELKIDEDSFGI